MTGDLFKAVPDPLIGRTLDGRYEVLGRLGDNKAARTRMDVAIGRIEATRQLQLAPSDRRIAYDETKLQ